MKLTIGSTTAGPLYMPLDAVTQTFAILAKKGKGKSYMASVMAEEMLKAGQQIAVLDPTGAWYGLQSTADGKRAGFPIVVFGGDHGNVPLEENAGEVIAEALVEKGFSAVLDLSLMRKNAANRFAGIFLETLYRKNRMPLHLFVDEADAFAPQRTFGDDARTLGAMEDIVRRGRIRGIGCTLITQRPQVINKNVLTQAETLIAGGMNHPKDIAAIEEWINVHADTDEADIMIESLPALSEKDKWIWSPEWMDCFVKVRVRKRETFDSGATPKPGEKVIKPQALAQIDIEALGNAITETVERKKAEDPKALRARIVQLERERDAATKAAKDSSVSNFDQEYKEREHYWKKQCEAYGKTISDLKAKLQFIRSEAEAAFNLEPPILVQPAKPAPLIVSPKPQTPRPASTGRVILEPISVKPRTAAPVAQGDIPAPRQRILDALAWLHACRIPRPNRTIVAYLADASPSSSGFQNNLGALRTSGYIDYPEVGKVCLTAEGESVANSPEAPATPEDLHASIYSKLPNPQCNILRSVIRYYPNAISRDQLAEEAGATVTSSGFQNNLGALRSLGLIDYPRQGFVAGRPVLFLED